MRKKIILASLFFLLGAALFFSSTVSVRAQQPPPPSPGEALPGPDLNVSNPLTGTSNSLEESGTKILATFFGGLAGTLLLFVGVVAFAVFFYGGFIWMTSAGNQDKVKKAKAIMTWAVVGLFAIFASYVILSTVIQFFRGLQS